MNSPICSSCNSPVPVGAIFCDNCGYDLRSAPVGQAVPQVGGLGNQPQGGVSCPSCSVVNAVGAQFCENCGTPLGGQAPQQQQYQQPQQYQPPQQQQYQPPQQSYGPPQGGIMCPSCSFANVEGAQFCENCGSSLGSAASAAPVSFPHPIPPPPVLVSAMPVNVGVITGRFVVQSSNTQLNFPQGKGEISIGREDPVSNVFPDINLDPYGGFDAGVSRMHAKLILQNGRLVLHDLNAANGTFVNKQKLAPNSHHPVNNGDELRFGQLSILYYSS